MRDFIERLKTISQEDLSALAKMTGGMALLVLMALFVQNNFSIYGKEFPAAVAYWQQSSGWGGSTNYPSPGYTTACIWDNSTGQVAGGEQDANCYWNPVTAILDAQPVGGTSGKMAYAQYWCSTQASDHSCSTYTATQGTTMPLLVAASAQVQLDYACQPGQASVVYSANGTKYTYATTTYATAAAGTGFTTSGLSGSVVVTAPASGSTTYKLTCSGGTGGPYTASVMVTADTISISNSATNNTVPSGTQATVSWSSSGLKAASCSLAGPTVSTSTPNTVAPTSWTNISSGYNDSTSTLSALYASTIAVGPTTDYLISGAMSNGGPSNTWQNQTAVYAAPASNPTGWTDTGGRLPSFAYAQSAVVGNTIYLFGGLNYPTFTYSSAIYSAPVSNPSLWTNTGQHLPVAIADASFYNDGTNLYLIAGGNSSGWTGNIYKASASNPLVWSGVVGTVPVATYQAALVQGGSYLYFIPSGAAPTIYRASTSNPLSWQNVGALPAYITASTAYVDTTHSYLYTYGTSQLTGQSVIYRAPLSTSMTSWTLITSNVPIGGVGAFQASNGNVYRVSNGSEWMMNPTASTTLWTTSGTLLPLAINPNSLYTVNGNYYASDSGNNTLLTAPVSNPTNWSVISQVYQQFQATSNWTSPSSWWQNIVPQNFVFTTSNGDLYSSVLTHSTDVPSTYDAASIIAASSSSPTNWKLLSGQLNNGQQHYNGLQTPSAWYYFGGNVAAIVYTGQIYQSTSTAPQVWTYAGASIPGSLSLTAMVTDTAHNLVYVLGGYTGSATISNGTYYASLNTPTSWASAGTLPVPLYDESAGIFPDGTGNNRIYVFGGLTTSNVNSQAIYQSSPLTGGALTWTSVGTLPTSALNSPLVTSGNTAYFLGVGSGATSILTAPLTDTNNGSVVTTPLTQTTTYTLSCLDTQGNTVATSTTLYVSVVAPTCAISSVTPPSVSGGTATITYTTTNAPTSGSVDNSIGAFTPTNPSGALASGPITFTSSPQNITYNMTVTNSAGSGTCGGTPSGSVTIPAACPANSTGNSAPSCTCTQSGYGYNSGTNTCAASDMCTDIAGSQPTVPTGCLTPSPAPGICLPAGYGYNSGTNTCVPPPTMTSRLTATPPRVRKGNTALLQWDVTGLTPGTVCGITSSPAGTSDTWNGSGTTYASPGYPSSTSGFTTASVNKTTTYTLSCSNAAGVAISSASVTMVPAFQEI